MVYQPKVITPIEETEETTPKGKPLKETVDMGVTKPTEIEDDLPLVGIKGPYLVHHLEAKEMYYSIDEIKEKVQEIDKWIQSEIAREGLKPTIGNYKNILLNLEKILGLTSDHDRIVRLRKMYIVAKLANKNKKLFSILGKETSGLPKSTKEFNFEELEGLVNG